MSIQGDLKEFSVPELFQFMQQHSKNGCLNIREERMELVIYFQEGHIVGVCPAGLSSVDVWCETLVRAGYLSEDEERRIKKRKVRDLVSFRDILIREGIIAYEELEELLQRQSQELLLRLLKLKKGSFYFSAEEKVPEDLKLSEPIFVEAFLLDGLRMVDEWPIMRKRIGSFQQIPHREFRDIRFKGGEAGKGALQGLWSKALALLGVHAGPKAVDDSRANEAEGLSSGEIEVYRQINGKRCVQEIIDGSMQGEYHVCKAILSLVEEGWIELVSPFHVSRGFRREAGRTRNRVVEGLYALSILFCIVVFAYGINAGAWEKEVFWNRFPEGRERFIYRYLNQQRRQIVVHALELFTQEHGTYPVRLEHLVDQRFLEEDGLRLLGQNSYAYSLVDKGEYTLMIVP